MGMKIIDKKKINLTADEWAMYESISRSYDRPNYDGSEMFTDLFETDDSGMIVFLKPPSRRHTSLEVCLFIQNLMIHQHIRQMKSRVDALCLQLENKINSVK